MTENKAKKVPILSLYAEYPNIPAWQNTFLSRVIYTRGRRRKATAFGGRGGKKEKKRRGRGIFLNHKCLPLFPSNKLKGCVLGIPRGKNKPTAFLSSSRLLSALPHRPGPAKWETAALRSVENCVLSALEIRRWNTGGQRREDPDRKQEGSTAPSPRAAK